MKKPPAHEYMDIETALALGRTGVPIRDDENMSEGWHIQWLPPVAINKRKKTPGAFFCYNPHAKGLTYQFTASPANTASTKWRRI